MKRVKCCGRLTLLYKRKREQYCSRCSQSYDLGGRSIGYFGSGKTKEEYHKEQADWIAKQHPQFIETPA